MRIHPVEQKTESNTQKTAVKSGFDRRLEEMVKRFEQTAFSNGRPQNAAEHWVRLRSGLNEVRTHRSVEDQVSRNSQPRLLQTNQAEVVNPEQPVRRRPVLARRGHVSRHLNPALQQNQNERSAAPVVQRIAAKPVTPEKSVLHKVSNVPAPIQARPAMLIPDNKLSQKADGIHQVPALTDIATLNDRPVKLSGDHNRIHEEKSHAGDQVAARARFSHPETSEKTMVKPSPRPVVAKEAILEKRNPPQQQPAAATSHKRVADMPDEAELRQSILRIESMLRQIRTVRM